MEAIEKSKETKFKITDLPLLPPLWVPFWIFGVFGNLLINETFDQFYSWALKHTCESSWQLPTKAMYYEFTLSYYNPIVISITFICSWNVKIPQFGKITRILILFWVLIIVFCNGVSALFPKNL